MSWSSVLFPDVKQEQNYFELLSTDLFYLFSNFLTIHEFLQLRGTNKSNLLRCDEEPSKRWGNHPLLNGADKFIDQLKIMSQFYNFVTIHRTREENPYVPRLRDWSSFPGKN